MENDVITEEKFFSTRDLGLATTLVTNGFQVSMIDFQYEGQRRLPVGYFSFVDTPDMRQVEHDFWIGACRVDPRTFLVNMRSLKSQVVGKERSPR